MCVALREFALAVRQHDPQRIIISGNAFPRVSAWHQVEEKSWQPDTRVQFAEVLAAENPSPINTLCVHADPIDGWTSAGLSGYERSAGHEEAVVCW